MQPSSPFVQIIVSSADMDTQSYRIEWFPQVCIDTIENALTLTSSALSSPTAINVAAGSPDSVDTDSEVITATVRVSFLLYPYPASFVVDSEGL